MWSGRINEVPQRHGTVDEEKDESEGEWQTMLASLKLKINCNIIVLNLTH